MSDRKQDVAIVGMSCVFPGAPDLATFRRNLERGVDAITDVPATRWEPVFYDPASSDADRFYCRRGGFVDDLTRFDPLAFGIMPVAAEGAEPDQMLALETAARALADAGYESRELPKERTAVILGRGGYMGPGMVRLDQHVRTAQQLVECLRTLVPGISEERLSAVKSEFRGQLGHYGPDTAIGLVPNLAASRVANRLDLGGPAYTVDAACASSLVAVDQACGELAAGRSDVVLAGGVHVCHDVTFWSVFCQLGALSRQEQIRPFDRRADGLLIGEGVGLVVLKRLADARRDGDRVYAVIKGTGVASDGRESSPMQPRVEGQLLALERAWKAAGLDPKTIGLLEAHGTGTPAGDAAELTTLTRFFGAGDHGRPGIGSVKSMIGHTMPAAGVAGLIKAALAVHHGKLLPTLHCEEPHELMAPTGFRPVTALESWEINDVPRRAGVNAFGFGGINAHVVLQSDAEGCREAPRRRRRRASETAREPMLCLAAGSTEELLEALDGRPAGGGDGPCRLALRDPTPERLARARRLVERGKPWRGREGISFTPRGLIATGGKVAFLFPGIDASFEPRVEDVAGHFGLPVPAHTNPQDLEETGIGVIGVGRLLHGALRKLGIRPDAIAGHSIGEWCAMIVSGMIPARSADDFIAKLVPGRLEVPGVVFAAAGCGAERVEEASRGLEQIGVSHDNCPHQVILCGREDSVDTAMRRLMSGGVLCQKLPFRSGFHSPLFAGFVDPHRENLAGLPLEAAGVPVWSATTCAPYPSEPDDIRALALEHLVRPVRFRELILRLHREGFRLFVQVGTGRLVGFVGDTLRDKEHLVVSANDSRRSGLEQLARVAGALWAEGVDVRLERLPLKRERVAETVPSEARSIRLRLGVPLARMRTELDVRPEADRRDAVLRERASSPVMAEYAAVLSEIETSQREVVQAWERAQRSSVTSARRPPKPFAGRRRLSRRVPLSVAAFPELSDHCFYRQPEGWPDLADRFPVVPMTVSISMMMEFARELVPDLVPVAVEKIRAVRWIAAEPPVELDFRADYDGVDRVDVAIEGYASATVRLAGDYPAPAPSRPGRLEEECAAPVSAQRLYADRWMFHGPRFQGVRKLGPLGRNGIRGVLEALPTRGALLDNAGQLFGYWAILHTRRDRIVFPFKVERITFHGPDPAPGTLLECHVEVLELTDRAVRADIELALDGRVWARIEGWEDRRFDTDDRLWEMMRFPERRSIATLRQGGYCLVMEPGRSSASRDLIARRFLSRSEQRKYLSESPRHQRSWLLRRMAVKDTVREWLWRRGHGPLFPVEIRVSDEQGRLRVEGPFGEDLRVSVAHRGSVAVAIVAEGREVGIDVERITPRGDNFERISFNGGEREMLPKVDRDEWVARAWVAKEAVAKARGTALPRDLRRLVLTQVKGERLLVDGLWVETRREGDCVVGWCGSLGGEP